MANIIGTKQYLTSAVLNKQTGKVELRVVKSDSTNKKLINTWQKNIATEFRKHGYKEFA